MNPQKVKKSIYCHSGESRNPVISIASGLRRLPRTPDPGFAGVTGLELFTKRLIFNDPIIGISNFDHCNLFVICYL